MTKHIFIHGITRRSGTNFLFELLRKHPDCATLDRLGEDFLLSEVDLLLEYVDKVANKWNPRWLVHKQRLLHSLSEGVKGFLANGCRKEYVLTKTPSVDNIDHFFEVFPDSYLIIVLRNGKDVSESAVKSFGTRYEAYFRIWSKAAKRIIDFTQRNAQHANRCHVVKYEDLYLNTQQELTKVLEFCELDVAAYDFQGALELPVYGSSSLGKDNLHWRPVERSKDFRPLDRSRHWRASRHYRYDWICGKYSAQLGYSCVPNPEPTENQPAQPDNPTARIDRTLPYFMTNLALSVAHYVTGIYRRLKALGRRSSGRDSENEVQDARNGDEAHQRS